MQNLADFTFCFQLSRILEAFESCKSRVKEFTIRTSEQLFYVSRFSNIFASLIVQFVKIYQNFVFSTTLDLKGH